MTLDLYELYDHAAGWRMPIRVHWHNPALAGVTFAEVPLLKIQRKAIEDKLNAAGGMNRSGDNWYIPVLSLHAIAVKSDEPDPERLVRWDLPEPDLEADADFARAFSEQRGVWEVLKNPQAVEVILGQINRFMLQWLVTHGRPINFGWGRLDALPVRANWKEYAIGRIFKRDSLGKRDGEYYTAGEYEFLRECITHKTEWLTAYDTEEMTMRWSMEFTPNKQFHAAAKKVEDKRIANAKKWKTNYLGQLLKAIREPGMVERLYENLVAFAKETNIPYGVLPDGSSPRDPPTGYKPTRSAEVRVQVHLVTGAAVKGHEGSALVPEDASRLHEVRPVQLGAQDVRDAGTEVDGAGRNEADSTRLPVLGSSEGQHG